METERRLYNWFSLLMKKVQGYESPCCVMIGHWQLQMALLSCIMLLLLFVLLSTSLLVIVVVTKSGCLWACVWYPCCFSHSVRLPWSRTEKYSPVIFWNRSLQGVALLFFLISCAMMHTRILSTNCCILCHYACCSCSLIRYLVISAVASCSL